MKALFIGLLILLAIAASGTGSYYYYNPPRPLSDQFRIQTVRRSDITQVVNSTGTVQPVLSVQVGAFVSGPVQKVLVDFNDKVKKDQLLAQVDPRNYKSGVLHAEAELAHAKADVARVNALLEQAVRNEKRNTELIKTHAISTFDFDQTTTDRKSLEAQVKLAEAVIQQSNADLVTAQTNLDFTDIKSPVDGIIIDRKVDPGQVVAAQFQTPVMFVVAPDLEKKVYVNASVDEADIGLIRDAQNGKQPVTFTVDAYPKDSFHGQIAQVRLNPTTVSNVVTYTVIVEAPNADLKLLPGMTANLAFQIDTKSNLLTVPNSALRFRPAIDLVRKKDRSLVDGSEALVAEDKSTAELAKSTDAAQRGRRTHVWVIEGRELAAIEVTAGMGDKHRTEIISGDLAEGRELVTGIKPKSGKPAEEHGP